METAMSARAEADTDLVLLTGAMTRLEGENARMRHINAELLAALKNALPILRDGMLPDSIDFDAVQDATTKIQNAISAAERD
jgi:hypothetical protein